MQEVLVDGVPISRLNISNTTFETSASIHPILSLPSQDIDEIDVPELSPYDSGALREYWIDTLKQLKGAPFVATYYCPLESAEQEFNLFTGGSIEKVYLTSPLMKHVIAGLRTHLGQMDDTWQQAFLKLLFTKLAHESYNSVYNLEPVEDDGYEQFFHNFRKRMESDFKDTCWFVMYETKTTRVCVGNDTICVDYPMITFLKHVLCNCTDRGVFPIVIDKKAIENCFDVDKLCMEKDVIEKTEPVREMILTFINMPIDDVKQIEPKAVAVAAPAAEPEPDGDDDDDDDGEAREMDIESDQEEEEPSGEDL